MAILNASGAALGSGIVESAAGIAVSVESDISGIASVSPNLTGVFRGSATFYGTGVFDSTPGLVERTAEAALSGDGSLGAQPIFLLDIALAGEGSFVGSPTVDLSAISTLGGAGLVDADADLDFTVSAALAGSAFLDPTATMSYSAEAPLEGVGTFVGDPLEDDEAASDLTGSASFLGNPTLDYQPSLGFAGSGSVYALATVRHPFMGSSKTSDTSIEEDPLFRDRPKIPLDPNNIIL